jgi:imidazolonepropionase-like amidohydrolase
VPRKSTGLVAMIVCACSASAGDNPLALAHVNVVDVETGQVSLDQTVLIVGNRIRTVAAVSPPPGARVVNAGGAYLIPGLWDMHTHNFDLTAGYDLEQQFALLVANGNTGVRDIGAAGLPLEEIGRIRTDVLEGRLLGPRFIAAGPLVDGPERRHEFSVVPESPEHARVVVDSLLNAGADFIKVYSNLRANVYRAIADQASRRGVPFAGHLPDRVALHEAVNLGQRSFEHLHSVRRVCSGADTDLAEWWVRWDDAVASGADTLALIAEIDGIVARLRTAHDESACEAGLAHMADRGAALAPTMVVKRPDLIPLEELERDDRLRYTLPATREWWMEDMTGRTTASPEEREATRRQVERERALVPLAARGGVLLLAATDITNEYTYPGFSLHDELEVFVEVGLTPLEALRTATLSPAVFLDATDSLGTVAPGKLADLVLLEANPLHDIQNTRRIAGVVLNGRYLDRTALDGLLSGVEQAVQDAAWQ